MIIIGMGRVGRGLRGLAEGRGVQVRTVSRDTGWAHIDPVGSGPILVCVNAGDLQSVIERVPRERRSDLVFVQNGMLDTFLDEHVCGANTRGLLYFAVPKLGADVQPGGASVFTGLHSDAIVDWFQRLGLEGRAIGRGEFSNQMASKLIWNCTFGLLCDVHDEAVDSVVAKHRDDVALLVSDLVQISNGAIGTTLGATETAEQLCIYSNSIPGYRATLKQWRWRNGWFVKAAQGLEGAGTFHRAMMAKRERRIGAYRAKGRNKKAGQL